MTLYVLRHGQTPWNKLKKLQGRMDIPLNENGLELATKTGEAMLDVPIDMVICSPLKRARQTAELITVGRNIPMIIDERIEEISFGDYEGESVLEGESEVIPEDFLHKFYNNPLKCKRPPHGETFKDVIERTKDFYESLVNNPEYKDKNILISSHGAASRCFLCNFYTDKTDIWRGKVPPNCSVTIVDVNDQGQGRVRVLDKQFAKLEDK